MRVSVTDGHINSSPVKAKHIKLWAARDPVLSLVLRNVCVGWNTRMVSEERPYFQ